MLQPQPHCTPSRDPVITSQPPLLNTHQTSKDNFNSPNSQTLPNFDYSLTSLSFFEQLNPLLSPKLGKKKCLAVTPFQPLNNKTRVPRSPMPSALSQVPLPESVMAIDASDVAAITAFLNSKESIIIDVRPYNYFSTLRISDAINICLPSTLLKRASFDLAHVLNSSTIPQSLKDALLDARPDFRILFYDQASEDSRITLQLYHTIMKFYEGSGFKVAYVNGGFDAIDDLLKDSLLFLPLRSPSSPSATLPRNDQSSDGADSSDTGLPFLSGFTLPSATKADVKLLDSIKKGVTKIDTVTKYKHEFKFPADFESKIDKLPPWLLFIGESYGKENCSQLIVDHLSERFNRLEASEQVRLSIAINNADGSDNGECGTLHNSSGYGTPQELCPCCDDITYTIPKGVEYGYKNRYKNVWPYEHSRVRLKLSPSCKNAGVHDDYFNANYIHFEELSNNKYIATQNPLESTHQDFWNAVWYNGVEAIVCLDNSTSLHSRKYYEEDKEYKNLSVHIKQLQTHEGFTYREIEISKHNHKRILHHFAYTDWPDFGTPDDLQTVIDMMQLKNKVLSKFSRRSQHGDDLWEMLVHCSAGCGRTGCFITLDMVTDLFVHPPKLPGLEPWGTEDLIYKSIQFQRQQRISMVQNLGQFIFCYESILNYVLSNVV